MKPVTPQEFAQDYGVFIADLKIIPTTIYVMKWLESALPDVALMYRTYPEVFASYVASVTTFPSPPAAPKDKYGGNDQQVAKANKEMDLFWNAITMDLRAALAAAEVDPNKVVSILASFAKYKPVYTPAKKYK